MSIILKFAKTSDNNMDLLNISTNWLCNKSIKSCLFIRDSDSETQKDIELLLENYENCVQLYEPNDNKEDLKLASKLFIDTKHDNSVDIESFKVKIHSFSILCSAKGIEIHGNHNEYVTTVTNELIDETDGLSMFRNDYQFIEPQEEISLTFRGFHNELWIYALLMNVVKVKPIMPSTGGSSIASIMNIMSVFGNSMKGMSSNGSLGQQENSLINRFSQLMGSKESHSNCVEINNFNSDDNSSKSDIMSPSEQSVDDLKCSTDSESQITSGSDGLCQCECHQKCNSHHNSSELKDLRQYIDQKFSDLETSIDHKFSSLENKMTAFMSLYFNK